MGQKVFFLLCMVLPLFGDTIYFQNDLTLECDVQKVTDKNITIKHTKGTFTFPVDRIDHIEYNFEKKRAMIKEGDFKSHYELGLWCFDCNQEDNALSQFLFCEGKPDVPDDVYLKIARIYLNKDHKEQTIEYYKKYLAKHPENQLVAKKTEELTGEQEELSSTSKNEEHLKKADEGLEILSGWRIEKWANPGTVILTKTIQKKTENKMLKVEYQAKSSDKTALRVQYRTDLTDKKSCVLDLYNPANYVISMAIAFVTSPGYNFYESKGVMLQPGWNLNIEFDLTTSDYKSKATNWTFKSDIKNKNSLVQFILLVYNGSRKGIVFIDNIKIE